MPEFKYGLLPENPIDQKHCQLKGDGGLYRVEDIIKSENKTTVQLGLGVRLCDSSARSGEKHDLKKIRFVSNDRLNEHQAFVDIGLSNSKERNSELKAHRLEPLRVYKSEHGKIELCKAMFPFMGMGHATVNVEETFAIVILDHQDDVIERLFLSDTPYPYALATFRRLFNSTTTTEEMLDQANRLKFNIVGARVAKYFNPLVHKEPVPVHLDKVCEHTITITNIRKDFTLGSKTEVLTGSEPYMLEFDEIYEEEFLEVESLREKHIV